MCYACDLRKITDTNTFFIQKANYLPPRDNSCRQSRRHADCPGWTPGPAGLRKQELPEVGQTGVVPQSLCEGLCSFVTNSVAPHPEGRGKTVNVSSCTPLTFCRSPHLLYSPRQRSLLCPGSSGLEKIPTEDPYRSCCRFQMRREM